jgi:hypothetical protein
MFVEYFTVDIFIKNKIAAYTVSEKNASFVVFSSNDGSLHWKKKS